MDIKHEIETNELETEEEPNASWLEVTIEPSNILEVNYSSIKEEIEDYTAVTENCSVYSVNAKNEEDDEFSRYKDEFCDDIKRPMKLEKSNEEIPNYQYTLVNPTHENGVRTNEPVTCKAEPDEGCHGSSEIKHEATDPFFKKAVIRLDKMSFHRTNFICGVCYRFFPSADTLRRHSILGSKSSADGERKRFLCKDCCFRTNNVHHFNCHKLIHTGERPFRCQQCKCRFSQASALKKHMMIHTGEKPFRCTECAYRCTSSSNLKKHVLIHTGETPFKCQECFYRCTNSSSLKKHVMIHNNDRPYECEQCNYKCTLLTYLKIHQKIHGGERKFKCNVCPYRCFRSGDLKKHKYVHTDRKPFKCAACEFTCINAAYLKTHNLIHTGEKPFTCDQCNFKCTQVSSLKRHKTVMHRERWASRVKTTN